MPGYHHSVRCADSEPSLTVGLLPRLPSRRADEQIAGELIEPNLLDRIQQHAVYLDNSLIIYGSPMGNPNVHNHKRCPLFFAGHAGGRLKGNIHIKTEDGTPMANAMLAGLQSLGVEIDAFGDSTMALDLNGARS